MILHFARLAAFAAATAIGAGTALPQDSRYGDRAPRYERNFERNERGQPGDFAYYVLALSWSPTYCAERRGNGYEPQCDGRQGRPYAFVLHGLWPQHERGWPQNCRTSDGGW